jgi:hypothetical protein
VQCISVKILDIRVAAVGFPIVLEKNDGCENPILPSCVGDVRGSGRRKVGLVRVISLIASTTSTAATPQWGMSNAGGFPYEYPLL